MQIKACFGNVKQALCWLPGPDPKRANFLRTFKKGPRPVERAFLTENEKSYLGYMEKRMRHY